MMRRLEAAAFVATAVGSLTFNAVAAVALGCSFHLVEYLMTNWIRPTNQSGTAEVNPDRALTRAAQ